MSSVALAVDQELFIPFTGDNEYYMYQSGDAELNEYFRYLQTVTPVVEVGGGAAPSRGTLLEILENNSAKIITTPYYDVVLQLDKLKYNPEETVHLQMLLINKGDIPDRDAHLRYYLQSFINDTIGDSVEVFKEVPPYFYNESECKKSGGVIHNTTKECVTLLDRSIHLPKQSILGEWKAVTEYTTEVQPKITVYRSFTVTNKDPTVIIIISAAVLFIITRTRRYKDGKEH